MTEPVQRHGSSQIQKSADLVSEGLNDSGAKMISVTYDGGGDEGYVEDVTVEADDSQEGKKIISKIISANTFSHTQSLTGTWTSSLADQTVSDAITELFSIILDHFHSGYEINDGGGGTFEWNLQTRVCENHHTYHFGSEALNYIGINLGDEEYWDGQVSDIKITDLPQELRLLHKNNISALRNAVITDVSGVSLNFRVNNTHIIFDEAIESYEPPCFVPSEYSTESTSETMSFKL